MLNVSDVQFDDQEQSAPPPQQKPLKMSDVTFEDEPAPKALPPLKMSDVQFEDGPAKPSALSPSQQTAREPWRNPDMDPKFGGTQSYQQAAPAIQPKTAPVAPVKTDSYDLRTFLPGRVDKPKPTPAASNPNAALIDSLNNPVRGPQTSTIRGNASVTMASANEGIAAARESQIQDAIRAASTKRQRDTAFDAAMNAPPDQKRQALIELGKFGQVSPEEAKRLGVDQSYLNNIGLGLGQGGAELLSTAAAGLKHLPIAGLPGTSGNASAISPALGKTQEFFGAGAQQAEAERNVRGKGGYVGDVLTQGSLLAPDLLAIGVIGPEGLAANTAAFSGLGAAKTLAKGGTAGQAFDSAFGNAIGALSGHVLGDLPLAGKVFGNAGLGVLVTAVQGGDRRAMITSGLLYGFQGALAGGGAGKEAQVLESIHSPDVQAAAEAYLNNPTPEGSAALARAIAGHGFTPDEGNAVVEKINEAAKVSPTAAKPDAFDVRANLPKDRVVAPGELPGSPEPVRPHGDYAVIPSRPVAESLKEPAPVEPARATATMGSTEQVKGGAESINPTEVQRATDLREREKILSEQGQVRETGEVNRGGDNEQVRVGQGQGDAASRGGGGTEEGQIAPGSTASVKASITKADEAALKARGYSDDDIYKMKPADAQRILESPEVKPNEEITGQPTNPPNFDHEVKTVSDALNDDSHPLSQAIDRVAGGDTSDEAIAAVRAAGKDFDPATVDDLIDGATRVARKQPTESPESRTGETPPAQGGVGQPDRPVEPPKQPASESGGPPIDENRHWNFRRSQFSSAESEQAFRDLIKKTIAENGEAHKTRVTQKEFVARANEIDPELAKEAIKNYKPGDPVPSREIFHAAAEYAQNNIREVGETRAFLRDAGDELTPAQRQRLEDHADRLEHDAKEAIGGAIGVRSEFGRNLALLATMKGDTDSPAHLVRRADAAAKARGDNLTGKDWQIQRQRFMDLGVKLEQAKMERDAALQKLSEAPKAAGKSTKASTGAKPETWQQRFTSKLDKMEQDARARLSESLSPNTMHDITDLPRMAADLAIILASKIAKKGIALTEIRKEMIDEFGTHFTQDQDRIERAALLIHDDQRLEALTEAAKVPNKEVRKSALAELKGEVAKRDQAERKAAKEAEDIKKSQIKFNAESRLEAAKNADAAERKAVAAEARAKAVAARDEQRYQEVAANRSIRADQFEKQQQEAAKSKELGAAETDAQEARRQAEKFNAESRQQQAKAEENLRKQQAAADARESAKKARQAQREAEVNEQKAIRQEGLDAKKQAAQEANPVYQLRVQGKAVEERLSQPGEKATVDDLARVGAAKLHEPGMSAAKWTAEMQRYGKDFTDNQREIRESAAKLSQDAKDQVKVQQQARTATAADAYKAALKQGKTESEARAAAREARASTGALTDEQIAKLKDDYASAKAKVMATQRELAKNFANLEQGIGEKASTVIKAGLISSARTLGKIVLSHSSYMGMEIARKVPSAIADMALSKITGNDRTAGGLSLQELADAARIGVTRGLPDAYQKLKTGYFPEGEDIYSRVQGTSNPLEAREFHSNSRVLNAWVNGIMRTHGAVYSIHRVMGAAMALREQANLASKVEARNAVESGKIQPGDAKSYQRVRSDQLFNNPSETMTVHAIEAAEEMAFVNESRASKAVSGVKTGLTKIMGKFAADRILPFAKVPANVAARTAEGALGVGIAPVRAIYDRISHGEFTPEDQARFVKTFGRGTVGAGIMAAGYLAASQGYATGYVQGYDDKATLKIGGRSYHTGLIPPLGTLFALGATLYELQHFPMATDSPMGKKVFANAVVGSALRAGEEQPMLGELTKLSDLVDSKDKKHALTKFFGGIAGQVVPTLVSDTAAQIDRTKREKDTVMSYVQERIPGARNYLKPSPFPGREPNKLFDPFASIPTNPANQSPGVRLKEFRPKR